MAKEKEDMLAIASGIKQIQELQDASEKKFGTKTAETEAAIKKIGDDITTKFAEVQEKFVVSETSRKAIEAEVEKVKKDYDELYKKSMRPSVKAGDEPLVTSRYKYELARYLRKGVGVSSDALNELATNLVAKSIDPKDEQATKNAIYNMLGEQGVEDGKGFYMPDGFKTGMVEGSNPDGGYTVLPDRRTDITVGRIFETSPMRAIAQIITTGTNEVEIPIDDDQSASGGWQGSETTAPTDTANAKLGLLKILVHEQFAQPKVTQRLLDDSFVNIEAWLAKKTNDILTRTENTAFVSGTGSNQPKGFLSYDAWTTNGVYQRNALEHIKTGVSGAITGDSLRFLQGALLEEYQGSAVFMTKRDNFTTITTLKDGVGRYLMNPLMIADGVNVRLLGKPVYFANDMQAIAADALAVAYGDFGTGYTIVDRMGIRILRDPFTAKPYVKFYTTKRVGGAVTNYQSVKILQLT